MRHLKRLLLISLLLLAIGLPTKSMAQYSAIVDNTEAKYDNGASITPTTPAIAPSVIIPAEEWKNHIQVGTGLAGWIQFLLLDLLYVDVDKEDYYPENFSEELDRERYYRGNEYLVYCLSMEYGYKVKDFLSLGAKGYVGFKTQPVRHVGTNDILYRDNHIATAALFNIRFDWLRREVVTMYSSIGLGATICIDERRYSRYVVAYPIFDITWVGINVGRRVYGFAEFGGGVSGVVRAGIGVRF